MPNQSRISQVIIQAILVGDLEGLSKAFAYFPQEA